MNDIVGHVSDKLIDEVFGDKLARAGDAADELAEQMRAFLEVVRPQAMEAEIDAVLDGLRHLAKALERFGVQGVAHLGAGGLVMSPTLALVGESGPEAVVPLSSRAFVPRGGGGFDEERLVELLVEALREQPVRFLGVMPSDQLSGSMLSAVRRAGADRQEL